MGVALFAYVVMICLTGSALVYRPELYRHFEPQPLAVEPGARLLSDAELLTSARRAFPAEQPVEVWRGREPHHAVEIDLVADGERRGYLFNPYSGEALRPAMPLGFWAVTKLLELHTDLLGGPDGRLVNGALALGMVFLALTGVLVWRPQPPQGPSTSNGRRTGGLRRLHRTAGIWAAPFVLMWGVTGINLTYPAATMAVVDYFEPFDEASPVERVGDKVSYWLAYLHFGRFGGRVPGCSPDACGETLKVVWAAAALVPAFLAGSGLVLWLRGRRARARVKRAAAGPPTDPPASTASRASRSPPPSVPRT